MKKMVCIFLSVLLCLSITVNAVETTKQHELESESIVIPTVDYTNYFENPDAFTDPVLEASMNSNARINVYGRAWFYALRTIYSGNSQHYSANSALDEDNFFFRIYGQDSCSDYLVGNSTMDEVGCEIIAAFNMMASVGERQELSEVIRHYEQYGYLMASAYLGSDPYAIEDYADIHGVEYTAYPTNDSYGAFYDEVMDNIDEDRFYVASYWLGSRITDGVHGISFYSHDGDLYIHNLYNSQTQIVSRADLADFIESDRFITGYAFGEW